MGRIIGYRTGGSRRHGRIDDSFRLFKTSNDSGVTRVFYSNQTLPVVPRCQGLKIKGKQKDSTVPVRQCIILNLYAFCNKRTRIGVLYSLTLMKNVVFSIHKLARNICC